MWPERTDPQKFVYEDIAIAAYLLVSTGTKIQCVGSYALKGLCHDLRKAYCCEKPMLLLAISPFVCGWLPVQVMAKEMHKWKYQGNLDWVDFNSADPCY